MPFFFDLRYMLAISPALLLMMWAQWRIKSTYAQASQVPARMSGAEAARRILDAADLHDVGIEPIAGMLSDHYDPRTKVLRLSEPVYSGHSAASVGIAAHEAGHALQDAQKYAPLVIRNLAVPAANFGSNFAIGFIMLGMFITSLRYELFVIGVACFGVVALFQIVNLPVEFDASHRAKRLLAEMGIVDGYGSDAVNSVLNAAAWTYVAGTLQAVLTMLYYAWRLLGNRDR